MHLRTPQKLFSLTFRSPVWQIRPDFEQEILAVELRDGDRLQTEFVVIDCKSGQARVPYQAAENWWVGLEETNWQLLFLHGFADRKVGAHAGLTVVRAAEQNVLWQHEEVVFYGLAPDFRVLVQPDKNEKENFVALDAFTGAVLETAIPRVKAQALVSNYARTRTQPGFYPVQYSSGSEYFELLRQFILTRSGRQVVGPVDYLEVAGFLILNYYEPNSDGKWQNLLGIYAADNGVLILEEVLNASVTGVGTDSFLVMNRTLLFIKEKNTLVGYKF